MADPKEKPATDYVSADAEPGDVADEALKQMPGKPPNLTVDPGKRYDDLARQSGDRALAEEVKEQQRDKK